MRGSHRQFAEFLQHHIESPKASSCLTSKAKPITFVKPISLVKPMTSGKSVKKGGRQRCGNTAKDLPPDLYELYKSDPEESYGECKSRVQWIHRYWAEQWFLYHFVTPEYTDKNVARPHWADIVYRELHPMT